MRILFTCKKLILGGYGLLYNWFVTKPRYAVEYGYLYNWWVTKERFTVAVKYGYLYNWYAIDNAAGIAGAGWHVPTKTELETLVTELGGSTVAGGHLKETGTTHWNTPNTGADNSSGFNGVGSGVRGGSGVFSNITNFTWILSSTLTSGFPEYLRFNFDNDDTSITNTYKYYGFSLRLVCNSTTDPGHYIGNDGRVYATVKIGDQVWISSNLMETKYSDGSAIPEETDNDDWAALTSGARCSYDNDEDNAGDVPVSLGTIAKSGWHVPTKTELETLRDDELGGWSVAGGHLKETGTTYWDSPNTGADNSSGFSARGSSIRSSSSGLFANLNTTCHLWSATEDADILKAYGIDLQYDTAVFGSGGVNRKQGSSIRLVCDSTTDPGYYVGNDGKVYTTVKIGDQVWMAENLMETLLADLTEIEYHGLDNGANFTAAEWAALTTAGRCSYDNDEDNAGIDIGNIAITGWHVPTKTELDALVTELGGDTVAGGYLKEAGLNHWSSPNTDADNSSGFTGRGAGYRESGFGDFVSLKEELDVMSADMDLINVYNAVFMGLYYNSAEASVGDFSPIEGHSIRLIKDDTDEPETETVADIDGNEYGWVVIGDQIWLTENLKVKKYSDGTEIPGVTDGDDWIALDTGAWCYYDNDSNNM